ncbi:MAG TPA: multicopper oxidase domain-containing protein [Roseiarcus sp.]|jgi:FtsP/CotA-like multicopper oxidase with cupredoxin domain|nr:multicopper oxidase domain-containing protein [Roseiarcus sp.]
MTFCPDRRSFLTAGVSLIGAFAAPRVPQAAEQTATEKADYTLRIGTGLVELSPDHIVSTTLYNGQFPGPLLRMKEGRRVVIDIYNDTDTPELVHSHGLMIPSSVDGAAEEGSPFVPPHGMLRIAYVPRPSGFRFYHTHVVAGGDLSRGTYTGQFGPIYIEPAGDLGAYDREAFLVMKEFEPSFSRGGDMATNMLAGAPIEALKQLGEKTDEEFKGPKGYEVGYELFGINGKMLGEGEPIRVKQGERVLFHVLNASATEIRSLALPGHVFRVVALDGNPVPTPAEVPVLWLGTAERVSAIVEMRNPGVWVMGDLSDDDRSRGMGIVIEYAGESGKPQWEAPAPFRWDYTQFGKAGALAAAPEETLEITVVKRNGALNGFNQWALNGEAFSMATMRPSYLIRQSRRYRIRFRNASDDVHPLHLHRHSFELVRVGGKPTAGVIKDVVMLGGYQEVEFDFIADNPGPTLFHCHQQLHMDFGFMALFNYA